MERLLDVLSIQRTRKQSGQLLNHSTILKNPVGTFTKTMGIGKGDILTLNWDESIYLLEKGNIDLMNGNIPISLQEAYNILISSQTQNHYKTFRELKKMGFIVFPWNVHIKSRDSKSQRRNTSWPILSVDLDYKKLQIFSKLKSIQGNQVVFGYKVFKPNSQFKKSNLQNPDFYVLTFQVDSLINGLEMMEWIQNGPIYLSIVDGSDISFIKLDEIKSLDT